MKKVKEPNAAGGIPTAAPVVVADAEVLAGEVADDDTGVIEAEVEPLPVEDEEPDALPLAGREEIDRLGALSDTARDDVAD